MQNSIVYIHRQNDLTMGQGYMVQSFKKKKSTLLLLVIIVAVVVVVSICRLFFLVTYSIFFYFIKTKDFVRA